MAKERNSLGLLVFPTTGNDQISWDEYKKRTGIDLEKIFVIGNDGTEEKPNYYIRVGASSPSKLFVISNDGPEKDPMLPKIIVPTHYSINYAPTLEGASFNMSADDAESGIGCAMGFNANKTVTGGNY